MRESLVFRVTAVLLLLTITPAMSGCGVIFGGTKQVVQVNSSPDGALVKTAPETTDFKTPASISLERKTEYYLSLSMPGYSSQKIQLQRSIRGGIVVLDILLCCLPVIIDAVTGGWYKLSPQQVTATLARESASTAGPEQITVTVSTKSTKEGGELRVESSTPGVTVGVRTQ